MIVFACCFRRQGANVKSSFISHGRTSVAQPSIFRRLDPVSNAGRSDSKKRFTDSQADVGQCEEKKHYQRYSDRDDNVLPVCSRVVLPFFNQQHDHMNAPPEQWQRLIAFARLIHTADDDAFDSEISEFLDMDEFFSFLSVNVILSNLDSFLGGSQNYYAYLDPTSNKFQLLPWDLDISFGAFEMLGTPDARRDLSIDRPQVGQGSNRLIERVLSIPRYKQAYRDRIQELMESLFAEKKMIDQIEESADFVGPLVALEGETSREEFQRAMADKPQPPRAHAVKYFVRTRRASLLKQLAGRSEGQHLAWENPEVMLVWIGVGIGCLVAGILNATAWVWSGFAGFRDSKSWGFLNLCFYPIAPMIYGFRKRSDLGRGAAILVLCSSLLMTAVFVVIGVLASSS